MDFTLDNTQKVRTDPQKTVLTVADEKHSGLHPVTMRSAPRSICVPVCSLSLQDSSSLSSLLSPLTRNLDRGQTYEDLKNTPTQAHEVAAQTEELLNEEPCQHCVIRNEYARNLIQTIRTLEEEHDKINLVKCRHPSHDGQRTHASMTLDSGPLFNLTTSEEIGVQCDLPRQPSAGTRERVDLLDRLRTTIEVLEAENQGLKLQLETCEGADYKGNNRWTEVKIGSLNIQYRCKINLVAKISPGGASGYWLDDRCIDYQPLKDHRLRAAVIPSKSSRRPPLIGELAYMSPTRTPRADLMALIVFKSESSSGVVQERIQKLSTVDFAQGRNIHGYETTGGYNYCTGRHRTVFYEQLPSQAGFNFINRLLNSLKTAKTPKAPKARFEHFQVSSAFYSVEEIFTVGSETVEMDDVETANEVPRGPDMGGGCCSRVVPDPPASH
ncbi:hypothetical protein J6590_073830 [Homalodisca vitripennis]|nr:hypothetical protein J6590_073830 [Homalodisca vitripennis]